MGKFQNLSSKTKILWNGSQASGTIPLNDDINNYDMVVVYFDAGSNHLYRPNIHLKVVGYSIAITDFMRATLSIRYSFSNNKFNITYNELGQKFKYIIGIKF